MSGRSPTDDLIARLAAAPAPARLAPGLTVGAMALALGLGMALCWGLIGLRPDLATAMRVPMVWAKSALPLLLAVPALWLALRAARPGVRLVLWPLAVPPVLAAGLFADALMTLPAPEVLPTLRGQTALGCLTLVTALSLAPIVAGVALLSRGASTRPVLSGALIGLASGAAGAAAYALHCSEDSPLFFVTWYGTAILIATGLGALAGARFLRW